MRIRNSCENYEGLLDQGKKLLDFLKDQEEARPFLEPVDHVLLEIPTYPKIIKNPMDLSTVEENLANKKYANLESMLSDVDLIWKNCMTFNVKKSVNNI